MKWVKGCQGSSRPRPCPVQAAAFRGRAQGRKPLAQAGFLGFRCPMTHFLPFRCQGQHSELVLRPQKDFLHRITRPCSQSWEPELTKI